MAEYTDADLQRACDICSSYGVEIAQLIADVRAEERERCARIADSVIHEGHGPGQRFISRKIALLIRRPDNFESTTLELSHD